MLLVPKWNESCNTIGYEHRDYRAAKERQDRKGKMNAIVEHESNHRPARCKTLSVAQALRALSLGAKTAWTQTTLYDLVEAIRAELKPGEEHLLTGIMLHLSNTRRLRPSQRWARIRWMLPIGKIPVPA
jgi:hypothetical protein